MLQLLLIGAVVLTLCVVCNKISNKIGIPVLLAFILLGMIFGSDGLFKIPFENFDFAEDICTLGLIIIIFYGGFGTNWKQAKKVALPSLLLASVGVLVTAGLTGAFCHLVLNFTLMESLLIGAVLSSTDAASVFSILRSKKLNLKDGTASLLELESGSNDPWAYMLTFVLLGVMSGGTSTSSVLYLLFAQVAYGVAVGVVLAWASVWVLRHVTFEDSGFCTIFTLAVALFSYVLPSLVGGNGYLSTYIVGIVLGNQKMEGKKALVHFFDGLSGLTQIAIFFLLGLLSFPSQMPQILGASVAIALFLSFVSRPAAVALIMTPFGAKLPQQALISWAGLRGATSIVFAIMATVSTAYTKNDVFHISFCVVLFSIGIQGTLLPFVSRKLGMIDDSEDVLKTFSDYAQETPLQFIRLAIDVEHDWCGKKIKEIVLPPKTRVVMIFREKKKVLPRGDTDILPGDILILSAVEYVDDKTITLSEVEVEKDHPWAGHEIQEIDWENTLVVLIQRGSKTLMPCGGVTIQAGDVVVLTSE